MKLSIDFSTRYLLLGAYSEKSMPTVHFYFPFVRLTVEWWPE